MTVRAAERQLMDLLEHGRTVNAVGELVNAAFRHFGGKGKTEVVILRPRRERKESFATNNTNATNQTESLDIAKVA